MNTRELGKTGYAILIAFFAFLGFLLTEVSCATTPVKPAATDLWGLCRAECSMRGADAAMVVGTVAGPSKPNCLCREQSIEPRGGI